MATKDFTALSNEQLKTALAEIATLACSIDSLLTYCDEDEVAIAVVRPLVAHMGMIADRCKGFDVQSIDSWMLPPSFESESKEASHV